MMLLQNDSFRDINAWFDQLAGRSSGQRPMPMDAYKRGDDLWVHIDLPGVAADSIDIDVERNVLTVTAERSWHRQDGDQIYLSERHRGAFRRQVHLGDGLDSDRIEADYHDGVLTLRIPVAEIAKPRKIAINTAGRAAIEAESADSESVATG
ncbi:Hsp20/alpha crystallin family protein [Desertimonas flava]|jgi:HSP20 family protein|uniref:Hsp20/alpha crystallin family protein n=1 Tax=Desertimonas flava TaxID=2064846 RepID=UPI000E3534BD|nr:Hsp20/alpha crystallin family protein [Desertimonas flava]